MPRKTFTAGEVLAAADVNTFLMDQSVMTFADSAARGSAIPTPSEGMVTYLDDTDALEVFNGTSFVPAAPASGGSGNAIINGAFEINQRNLTSSTAGGFGFDRWFLGASDGTVTQSAETFTLGAGPTGYESAKFCRIVTTGQTATNAAANLQQFVEDVRSFAGQTVAVSFFAKANSGTPDMAIELQQDFGTGGSPSSTVFTLAGKVTLSTSWQRFTVSVAVPSISGKTIGTAGNSSLKVRLFVSAGTDFNARLDSLGIQSNTFDIWGVQLEAGSTATEFRRNANSLQGELAACQRYFEKSYNLEVAPGTSSVLGNGFVGNITQTLSSGVAGNSSGINFLPFKVTKRAAPTMRVYDFDGTIDAVRVYPPDAKKTGVTGLANIQQSGSFQFMSFSATATALNSGNNVLFSWTADSEL